MSIPNLVALALQADGWYLRSDIIWKKPAPMPESVTDRPTSSHEHVFLLTKSPRYFYDAEAVREAAQNRGEADAAMLTRQRRDLARDGELSRFTRGGGSKTGFGSYAGRNLRNVWTVGPEPFPGAHFAVFPTALVTPCIKAGTSERGCCPACGAPWVRQLEASPDDRVPYASIGTGTKASVVRQDGNRLNKVLRADGRGGDLATIQRTTTGWSPSCLCPPAEPVPCVVLDPFGGSGTVGMVAGRLQRDTILIELNPKYVKMARDRVGRDLGLMGEVRVESPLPPIKRKLWIEPPT